jgi:hypothetical protein
MYMIKSEISELFSQRCLVFMETEPQSNKYNQVILSKEQFKKVSYAIISTFDPEEHPELEEVELRDGMEIVNIELSEEEYTLPDLQQNI